MRSSTLQEPALEAWTSLQRGLGGSFTARRQSLTGLVSGELTLFHSDGQKLGWLRPDGLRGAHLEVGGLAAEIKYSPGGGHGYRMSSAGLKRLVAAELPGPGGALPEVSCAGRTCDLRVNRLRNSAAVRVGGREVVSLEGNFTGLRYRAALPEEDVPLVLPAALFLLYYVPALRSRAYLAGPGVGLRPD